MILRADKWALDLEDVSSEMESYLKAVCEMKKRQREVGTGQKETENLEQRWNCGNVYG